MDRITREAIDERLRVLEGVSGAVYRCIDDLMRMRSALPTSGPVPAVSPVPPIAQPDNTDIPPTTSESDAHPTSTATTNNQCNVPSGHEPAVGERKMNGHTSLDTGHSHLESSDVMAERSSSSSSPPSMVGEESGPQTQRPR
jgi:E3 ubiquitin-protein ligase synoviolin